MFGFLFIVFRVIIEMKGDGIGIIIEIWVKTTITCSPDIYAIKPQASFLMWLDCRRLGLDHAQLVRFFAEEAHLALNNGEIYGVPGYCHMRLNVGTPRPLLEKAMEQLRAAVARLKQQ
jgi:cystathionine beta-lyase